MSRNFVDNPPPRLSVLERPGRLGATLRWALGSPTVELHPAEWRRRRRRRVGAWSVAGTVLVVLTCLLVPSWRDDPAPPASAVAADPGFDPPRRLRPEGALVVSRVRPGGVLEVTHWIRSRAPLDRLSLNLPLFTDRSGPEEAVGVRVLAGGRSAAGPARIASATGSSYYFVPSRTVVVRYRLRDALDLSGPDGERALARTTSLDVGFAGRRVPTTYAVRGATVLSLACFAGLSPQDPRPCGGPDDAAGAAGGDRWTVDLGRRRSADHVMAQLDLS